MCLGVLTYSASLVKSDRSSAGPADPAVAGKAETPIKDEDGRPTIIKRQGDLNRGIAQSYIHRTKRAGIPMPHITNFAGFEVVWQTYLVSCAKFKMTPGLLRVLVQHFIVNEEVEMVNLQAARVADEQRRIY